jgi:hypothetical protein
MLRLRLYHARPDQPCELFAAHRPSGLHYQIQRGRKERFRGWCKASVIDFDDCLSQALQTQHSLRSLVAEHRSPHARPQAHWYAAASALRHRGTLSTTVAEERPSESDVLCQVRRLRPERPGIGVD